MYGLTETTGAITQLDASDHDPDERPHLLRSCGKPYPWVELRIVDPETGDDVPTARSASCGRASARTWRATGPTTHATAKAITADGWFQTGDAGYLDEDGYLYLHDRVKDMIVSGGENVYPAEVENVLAKHPGVADVAVIGVPDERWGEAVKAIVVLRDRARRHRRRAHRVRARTPRGLQAPEVRRLHRRAAAQPVGQAPQARDPQPLLGRRDRQIG